jgi:EmrB/QacA subfamily drug resistance transporter
MGAAGGAAGALVGGVLTQALGWEWVLFVNFPIGIAAALAAPRYVRESRIEAESRHFDTAGAVSVTGGLVVLVYALVKANDYGWASATTLLLLGVAAVLLAAFVVIESRSKAPLVPLRIFSIRSVTSANAIGLLVGASLFAMFYFISLYLQQVLGYSPLKTGIAYLPLAVGIIISAGLASALVERVGVKPTLLSGLALTTGGLLLFRGVDVGGSYVTDVLIPSVVVAFGLGLSFVPMMIASVAGVRDEEAGLASGLINTSQQVGGALGLAVLSAVATARTTVVMDAAHGAKAALPHALTEGFQNAFAVGAIFAAVAIVLGAVLLRGREVASAPAAIAEPEAA